MLQSYDVCFTQKYMCVLRAGTWGGCGPVHKPFTYHAGALHSFSGGDNPMTQWLNKQPIKAAQQCIKSGACKWTYMNHKASCQDDCFASQSSTPMVAHGRLSSSLRSLKLIDV